MVTYPETLDTLTIHPVPRAVIARAAAPERRATAAHMTSNPISCRAKSLSA